MTDENTQDSNSTEDNVSPERENASVAIANEFLSRATLGEALSQVSLNAVLQLAQARALQQARDQVKEMSDDEVSDLLDQVEKAREEAASNAESAAQELKAEEAEDGK